MCSRISSLIACCSSVVGGEGGEETRQYRPAVENRSPIHFENYNTTFGPWVQRLVFTALRAGTGWHDTIALEGRQVHRAIDLACVVVAGSQDAQVEKHLTSTTYEGYHGQTRRDYYDVQGDFSTICCFQHVLLVGPRNNRRKYDTTGSDGYRHSNLRWLEKCVLEQRFQILHVRRQRALPFLAPMHPRGASAHPF